MAVSGGVLDFSDARGAMSEARRAFAIGRQAIFLRETRNRHSDAALASVIVMLAMQMFIAVLAMRYGRTFPVLHDGSRPVPLAFAALLVLPMGSAAARFACTRQLPRWPLIVNMVNRLRGRVIGTVERKTLP